MISCRSTLCHNVLNGSDLFVKFVLCRLVPREFMEVVLTVPEQGIGGRSARCHLHKPCVSQGLESVRGVRTFGYFSCFLLDRNKFAVNNHDLVGSAPQSSFFVNEQGRRGVVIGIGNLCIHVKIVFSRQASCHLVALQGFTEEC